MRAAGIPARIVTGYQGGTFNPSPTTGSCVKAMRTPGIEVWIEGRGWLRVDPTAAIAPERVEHGARRRR